ncbi:transcriptional regulator [bacterium]|nr:MAG: transcriptional regulator [bacterium]RKZ15268.1 MAG: transcriptional regulator [bacterium]
MILTAQEEFGLRCALSLARVSHDESLTLAQVGEAEGLTTAYAGKLLRLLVQAGLVESTRGRSGGYRLVREPSAITLREVVGPLGGPFYDGEICTKPAAASSLCVHNSDCAVRSVWSGMQGMVNEYLDRITLGDLVSDEATMDLAMEEIRISSMTGGK